MEITDRLVPPTPEKPRSPHQSLIQLSQVALGQALRSQQERTEKGVWRRNMGRLGPHSSDLLDLRETPTEPE